MTVFTRPKLPRIQGDEIARILLLALVAAWLLHPFATSRQIGAGDALWYANMLADFCLQWRAGVFPVFVGQTEFAFNGAVYPLRVAPFYQHLGGVLDLITGRQLSWFTLQHLCVIVAGIAGIFSCYFTLNALVPGHRWTAAGLAVLYLSCPGLLGTIYTQDLYMTWMTVPFVPLAFYGAVRAFQRDDLAAQIWSAAGLAALWMAHAPVALWATLLTAFLQLVRLLTVHRHRAAWKRALLGGLLFAALAQYPFISVAALNSPGAASTITGGLAESERISNVVREVFPAVLLPLTDHARALSDLQLGYGWWLILFCAIAAARSLRTREVIALLACAALLLFLLLPVPGNDWLWAHLPAQIKRITFYWPMHRFYILLAALLAAAGQIAFAAWASRGVHAKRFAGIALLAACGWSLWESRQFVAASRERTATMETTALRQRPENILLMNHAYGLFSALPPYFSNGVMDARAEVRLLDRATLAPLTLAPTPPDFLPLTGVVDENPGILKLSPTLRLTPNRRYELIIDFSAREYEGILQLAGRGLFREYALPASGERLAFGSHASQSRSLPLWTTQAEGDEITLRFIPTGDGATPAGYRDFAGFVFREVTAGEAPVVVTSLLPFQADVKTATPAWLEMPRMFQPGYLATIDGRPAEVARSPQGLVMIPVTPESRRVQLDFLGSFKLRSAYWATLAAWTILALSGDATAVRRLRS